MQLTDQPAARVGVPPMRALLSAWLQAARNTGVRLLRAGSMARRKESGSDSHAKAWTVSLGQVIAELDLLNHNTEQDFLRIGGKLAEFIEKVNLISSELTVLANLNSEEHGLRASQALTYALDRSMEMKARYADHNDILGGMRQEAGRLKQILSGFHGTVSTFQTLGVLTRIETARLGNTGADFGNLADDVRQMAGNVQAGVESALSTATLLIPSIESALQNISGLEEGHVKDLPAVISGVQASLASFHSFLDMQDRAHHSSVRLGSKYDAILIAFKKVIVSIQFHDLTRQQVEHVIEVLGRLCAESEGETGGNCRGQREAVAVLGLQSLQLADAGEKFAASVASVVHNLDDISAHVLEMSDESRTLSGISEDEENSFFLQMERGCTLVLASLRHGANAEAAARVASGGLAETIGRMRGSIEEMRVIEIQMQRMALNASLRAAHIGVSGDALGVLARLMEQQAFESRQRLESLGEALTAMSGAATQVSQQDGTAPARESGGPDGCLEEMRTGVNELHSSSERSFAQIAHIITCGARLREDLTATRQSFTVGTLFADAVSRARGMLKEIGEKNQLSLSRDGAEGLETGLTDFAKHYTMQSEHDVHEGVIKAAARAPSAVLAELPESPPKEAEELGENVEFF